MATWLYRLTLSILGLIFFYSGVIKIIDPQVFAVLIEAYGLVPEAFILPIAIILPIAEIVVAFGLLFDIRGSLSITTLLMLLFMAILSYGIYMGLDVDCGCFGPEDPETKAFHGLHVALCRDTIIMAGITYLYIWRKKHGIRPVSLKYAFCKLIVTKGDFDNASS